MTANKMALDALTALYRGYVNTLQAGRDRIIFLGGLGVLKNHEVDIEIVPPAIQDQQPDLVDKADQKTRGKRQTPEQALAAQLGQTADAE